MNLKLFKKRLNAFYSSWKKNKKTLWGNADVIVITTTTTTTSPKSPPDNHRTPHPKSSYFFYWLLGHKFPDTTAIFTESEAYFICPKKKFSMLQVLVAPAMEEVHPPFAFTLSLSIIQKQKGEDGMERLDRIIREIRRVRVWNEEIDSTGPVVVGYFAGECPRSVIPWSVCYETGGVNSLKYKGADVDLGFVKLFTRGEKANSTDRVLEFFGINSVLEDDQQVKDEPKLDPLVVGELEKKKSTEPDLVENEFGEKEMEEDSYVFEVQSESCMSEYCLVSESGNDDWEFVDDYDEEDEKDLMQMKR